MNWTSVDKELPEAVKAESPYDLIGTKPDLFLWDGEWGGKCGWRQKNGQFVYEDDYRILSTDDVTHWMKIQPPED